jgi:hypothetical protein
LGATGREPRKNNLLDTTEQFQASLTINIEVARMHLLSFLRGVDFLTTICIDTMVLVFSFPAFRRTKMPAFGFLILGSAIGIISGFGLQFGRATATANDKLTFSEFYRAGYVVAAVSWGIAIYQLIQYVTMRFPDERRP